MFSLQAFDQGRLPEMHPVCAPNIANNEMTMIHVNRVGGGKPSIDFSLRKVLLYN